VELPFSATCAGHGTDHGVVETESFDVAVQYGTYLGPLGEAFKLPCEYPTLCHFRWGRYAECLGQGNSLTVQYLTEHLVTTALHTTCELGREKCDRVQYGAPTPVPLPLALYFALTLYY
jgi:hypothetical protein